MEFVTELGADMAADGRHGDIIAAARKPSRPDGIDAVLALVGGEFSRAMPRYGPTRRPASPIQNGIELEPKKLTLY